MPRTGKEPKVTRRSNICIGSPARDGSSRTRLISDLANSLRPIARLFDWRSTRPWSLWKMSIYFQVAWAGNPADGIEAND